MGLFGCCMENSVDRARGRHWLLAQMLWRGQEVGTGQQPVSEAWKGWGRARWAGRGDMESKRNLAGKGPRDERGQQGVWGLGACGPPLRFPQ